uniref:Ribosomal protein L6 n=1 Tax=Picocystis salinarum TaxID=88271 RepID=A0A4D6C457_9CHLO|nr:ribosomal protein L6 [Picocystis salinarum]QBX98536.1 ribosomal protein L6 [Picocystis salinarum]
MSSRPTPTRTFRGIRTLTAPAGRTPGDAPTAELFLPPAVRLQRTAGAWVVKGPMGDCAVPLGPEATQYRWAPLRRTLQLRGEGATPLRRRLARAVAGVQHGCFVSLELRGVGFRAQTQGVPGAQYLRLRLGHSCDYRVALPPSLAAVCPSPTQVRLLGVDAATLGQWAARLVALRPPNPYTGKGVCWAGRPVVRKVGKRTR